MKKSQATIRNISRDSQHSHLDGKQESKRIINSLKKQIIKLDFKPGLAVILVGQNPASDTYIKIKEKRAREIGVYFEKHVLAATTSQKRITELITELNHDKKIHGILVQLPLPKKFNTNKIIQSINPEKDVDGFVSGKIVPPTIQGILYLINLAQRKMYRINSVHTKKRTIILANSMEFAEPLKKELEKKKIKTSIILKPKLHSPKIIKLLNYQIIIAALGKKYFLKPSMIKKDAIVIDVGINRVGKKIYGDVHPDCVKKSKYISPVPGGVGPLTVVFLMRNLVKLAKIKSQ